MWIAFGVLGAGEIFVEMPDGLANGAHSLADLGAHAACVLLLVLVQLFQLAEDWRSEGRGRESED